MFRKAKPPRPGVLSTSPVAIAIAFALSACGAQNGASTKAPEADLLARAQQVHAQTLILDAHADIALPSTSTLYLGSDGTSKVSPTKLRKGGVGAVVMSVAVGPGPRTPEGDQLARAEADEKLAAIDALIEQERSALTLATSAEAVRDAREQGKTAIILGFQNARPLQGDVTTLDGFHAAGVRVFGLNHIGHNDFSDSSRPLFDGETGTYEVEEEHGGLSELGRSAIRRINDLGGLVDISQMSKAATLQAIALSRAPVIASHSNVRALSDVTRNLSDEEIDLIGQKGGVIHIAAFSAYLIDLSDQGLLSSILSVRRQYGLPDAYAYPYELYWEIDDPDRKLAFLADMRTVLGRSSVARMVDHIDYVRDRIGIDHVGIGTDFNHGGGVSDFEEADDALNLTRALIERGYSDSDIEKIWSGNFLRAMAEAERGSSDTLAADATPSSQPAFCAEIPRAGWAAYEKHPSSGRWFDVYQLSENLYAIAEPHQWQEVISYLIIGEERALLFDSGNGMGDIKSIVDQLTELPITALASHSHIDHVGGHWQFDTVLAPDTDFTNIRTRGLGNDFVREEASPEALCAPLPDSVTVDNHHTKPFAPTGRVDEGTLIDLGGVTLEVLAIPGHTPDSIALIDRSNGRLFTGDSYYKGPIWLYAPETDLDAYRTSITRLASLVPELTAVHGAHNEPFSSPQELIKVRDGFEAVLSGRKELQEETQTQVRYQFDSFELLMQAGHE